MKRFQKIYLEISNICNLNCSFCPGTNRKPGMMSEENFSSLLKKLQPWSDYLYFHLMGEPLCHPKLDSFLDIASSYDFKVILTTNGTLLHNHKSALLNSPVLHKVNISLQAYEANSMDIPFDTYLERCFSFGKETNGQKLIVYRLWNNGGENVKNVEIISKLKLYFPEPWVQERRGIRIGDRVYLEHGDKFDWPDLTAQQRSGRFFCYGLRDQLGILCDGTVVPCCLDHNGDIPLGNLLTDDMENILTSERATALFNGFSDGIASEALCRRCGYASRFR